MSQMAAAQARKPAQSAPESAGGVLQRKCDGCRKKKPLLQRAAAGPAAETVPPIVHEVLRTPGAPLDAATRAFMEPRFGHDFSRVPAQSVGLQASASGLRIGPANDSYEQEADRVADVVMRVPSPSGDIDKQLYDFSKVRVHNDSNAAKSARAVSALAYTIGNDIVFGEGRYMSGTVAGRRLLAHELTHVVQQRPIGTGDILQRKPDQFGTRILFDSLPVCPPRVRVLGSFPDDLIAEELYGDPLHPILWSEPYVIDIEFDYLRAEWQPFFSCAVPVRGQSVSHGSPWSMCGRRSSLRVSGFTGDTSGTYISSIQVDIHPNAHSTVTLTWANGSLSRESLPTSFNASPGAGVCSTDCSNVANSQRGGSHCTPINSFTVQGYGCRLGSYHAATFVTWFHYAREIAFHYYDVPPYPASHGCVRLPHDSRGAEWIYDNTLAGITQVTVNRNASEGPGPKCWRGRSLVDRPSP